MKTAVMLSAMCLFVLSFTACELDDDEHSTTSRHETIRMGPDARNIDVTITNRANKTALVQCYTFSAVPTKTCPSTPGYGKCEASGDKYANWTDYTLGKREVLNVPVAFRVRANGADWEALHCIWANNVERKKVYADNPSTFFDP